MDASAIRQALETRPFQPFRLRLVDRREFLVTEPTTVAVAPSGRLMVVLSEETALIEMKAITSLLFDTPAPGTIS